MHADRGRRGAGERRLSLLRHPVVRTIRRAASAAKHQVCPSPETAAWRRACRAAAQAPRFTPGEIDLNGLRIAYADLLTLCPQWHDIFVRQSLRIELSTREPRILDCGANVGLASLYFKRCYPAARVTAFEGDPAVAALCRRNMDRNGVHDVEVQAAAVWRDAAGVRFHCEGADSGAIVGTAARAGAAVTEVPSVRLSEVIARDHVDLLKLDIEGAEHDVLADCGDVLDRVGAMLIDVHEFDSTRRRMPELLERLADAGFGYAVDNLTPLPWRSTAIGTPFPHAASAWAVLVRAWSIRS